MRHYRSGVLGATLVALALLASACGSGEGSGTKEGPTITIGSANFGENALVAEIYAQVLETNGYTVERNLNIGNREIYNAAVVSGNLDLVPEYVGSALSAQGGTPTADSAATTQALRDAWADKGVAVLDPAPAQTKNGIVVRPDTADALGLSKVSDLTAYTDLVFGGPPECPVRQFCLIGLTEVYGLSFADFMPLDVGGALTVAALEGDEIQVGLLLTSDAMIATKGFVLLEDDKSLQPAENLTPIIRQNVIDAYGDDIVNKLNEISAALTTSGLRELNRRIGIDGDDPVIVAQDWIADNL